MTRLVPILTLLLAACGGAEPSAPPAPAGPSAAIDVEPPSEAALAPEAEPSGDAAEGRRQELIALRLRVAELEAQIVARDREVEAAYADAERYRVGLERAVTELNKQARSRAQPPPPRSSVPTSRPQLPAAYIHPPSITLVEGRLRVTSEAYNPSSTETIEGDVVIQVDEGHGLREVGRIPLVIPPNSRRSFDEEMWGISVAGEPRVDVTWEVMGPAN